MYPNLSNLSWGIVFFFKKKDCNVLIQKEIIPQQQKKEHQIGFFLTQENTEECTKTARFQRCIWP